MTTVRIVLQPAFILHSRPYRDTSFLVELLTADYGRLAIVARGVRSRRSKSYGLFTPFRPLLISCSGKGDLHTLQQIESDGLSYDLTGNVMLCGIYLNELLIRLLQRHDHHPNIYHSYQQTLFDLADATKQTEVILRLFEKFLLKDLGYGLQLDSTVDHEEVLPDANYLFEYGVGLKKVLTDNPNNFRGQSLVALQNGELVTKEEMRDAKRLLRSVFAILLGNKPLKSRELFV